MRIAAIIFDTTDLGPLPSFYRDAFDLGEPSHVMDDHVGFKLENTYLGFDLVPSRTEADRPAATTWFHVDDARAWHERLLRHGAIDERAPDADCSPGEILAVVRDPEGNLVGLLSPRPPST